MADKSIVGTVMGSTTVPVERGKIREFATAILDDNPAYLEDPAPPAPPTFSMTQAFWPRKSDGPPPDLGLNYLRVLHGEQHFEYRKPIVAGDTITGTTKVADVYEKEGKRGGTMTFVVLETEWVNQDGDVALVSRNVLVETAKAAS
jgi:hydroxyacyl-ACP dehydratase HTD2-like protein with hotdog domain